MINIQYISYEFLPEDPLYIIHLQVHRHETKYGYKHTSNRQLQHNQF